MENKKVPTTSWNAVANWYDDYLETSPDSFQAKVIAPNVLRMLALKKGEQVIDLACGQGYFSRLVHEAGAHVVGVDLSEELIEIAKARISNIAYVVASAEKTKQKTAGFDAVLNILAFENIKNIDDVVLEITRVLKKEGRFILVLLHPSFRIPQHAEWAYDTKKELQYRRVDKYLSEIKIEIEQNPNKFKQQGKGKTTITFHRPLQWYMKIFKKHGLVIVGMEEWISHKASQVGPKKDMEDKARKEFPMFLALELRKI